MKRLGIFVFFDTDGIVDRYVEYLLDDLVNNLSKLIIVCNGKVTEEGMTKLHAFSKDIILRDNSGFDGAAYKQILIDYLPQKEVLSYDEIILLNDTFYGPFYSFEKIFRNMSDKRCDIWGLSKHEESIAMDVVRNAHIQSYFMDIKANVIRSKAFWDFWLQLGTPKNFDSAVEEFEIDFSKKMMQAGFIIDTYTAVEKYISSDITRNYNYSQLACGELICNYNYPILKRKNLTVCNGSNRNAQKAMEYIQDNYDYDVNMIWENALRRLDLNELRNGVGLDYIVSKHGYADDNRINELSMACVIFIKSKEYFTECLNHVKKLSDKLSVFFVVDSTVNLESIDLQENITVIMNERNLETALFLKRNKEFWCDKEFIISIYDEAINKPPLHRDMFFENIFTNIADCNEIIIQIYELFKKHERMGVLYPTIMPDINRRTWLTSKQLKGINEIVKEKEWDINFTKEKGIFQGRKSFWARTNVLGEILENFDFSDELWTILMPYVLQKKGFYPAYVSTSDYCSKLIGVYANALRRETFSRLGLEAIMQGNPLFSQPTVICNKGMEEADTAPSEYYRLAYAFGDYSLYIYGCGLVATQYMKFCSMVNIDIQGFIISNNEEKADVFMGRPVFYLSELEENEKTAVIIGVGKKNKDIVKNNLQERKIRNIIEMDKM